MSICEKCGDVHEKPFRICLNCWLESRREGQREVDGQLEAIKLARQMPGPYQRLMEVA